MKSVIYTLLFLFSISSLYAQHNSGQVQKLLNGYWEGAFIKDNSHQRFDIQFYKKGDQLTSLQIIEEWHPQFGEFEIPVTIDSTGKIILNTGYGKSILLLDQNNLEINGQIEGTSPAMYVHLKKVPEPPAPCFTSEAVEVINGDVTLKGHLHKPLCNPTKTAMIIVGGRGCYAGSTKYDLYAKILRKYGVSVMSYHKRGNGKSTGDCSKATMTDLASDVVAWKKFLEEHPYRYEKIGVLGSSAGGWVIAKAREMTDFDFMISIVGPSTSVKDQQLQSMDYGLESYKLSASARTHLEEYTRLMFEAQPDEQSFIRFQNLLKKAEKEGWKELLEDTDIPDSAEGINQLWVRRHNYDPGKSLYSYNKPFLAIYGEKDWVVPYKENIAKLNELFSGERKSLLTTVVAHQAEHGTEVEENYIKLTDNKHYWRFFRISPQVEIEIIRFLKKHGLCN